MKGKNVYILQCSYKDGDTENIGFFDSPLAMVEGLATAVAADANSRVKGPMELAKEIGRAVYAFSVVGAGLKQFADVEECRVGNAVYGWDVGTVMSCDDGVAYTAREAENEDEE